MNTDPFGFLAITVPMVLSIVLMAGMVLLLSQMIYLITTALSDRRLHRAIDNAIDNLKSNVKNKILTVITAIVAAYALAKTMNPNNRYEVHHIVAQTSIKAKPARNILKKVGIGIQDTRNKVLIKYNLHKRLHTKDYYSYVNTTMETAYNSGKNKSERLSLVEGALAAIKAVLLEYSATTP